MPKQLRLEVAASVCELIRSPLAFFERWIGVGAFRSCSTANGGRVHSFPVVAKRQTCWKGKLMSSLVNN